MTAAFNFAIPVAIGAVLVVLALGIRSLFKGDNPSRSNQLMRWRVLLQFLAVMLIALAAALGVGGR